MRKEFLIAAAVSSVLTWAAPAKVGTNSLRLPLLFEANAGQTDASVKYLSRTASGTVFLTADGVVVADGSATFRAQVAGARSDHEIAAEKPVPTRISYYTNGREVRARAYSAVRHNGIYPGVDLVYYGNSNQLEYDFEIAPGATARNIKLAFDPKTELAIDKSGDLLVRSGEKALRQNAPLSYQQSGMMRQNVSSAFKLISAHEVSFEVGPYDHSRPLVIDPVLVYSTYLGGTGGTDQINDIAVDLKGYMYVTGSTRSPNFPAVNSQEPFTGNGNAFVAKISPDGTSLVYSTFFGQGEGGTDSGNGVVADANGNAFFTGSTTRSSMLGAVRAAFLGKLNPDGSVAFFNPSLTGYPGAGDERPAELRLDPQGNIAVVGTSLWDTVPVVNGYTGFAGISNGFVIETDAGGYNIIYSTYIGTGSTYGRGIAVDGNGAIYVTGSTAGIPVSWNAFQPKYAGYGISGDDAYVVKIDPHQSGPASFVYGTFLGGSDWDSGNAITVDAAGNAWVTGETRSTYAILPPGFPVSPSAFQSDLKIQNYADTHCYGTFEVETCEDIFVTGVNPDGSQLVYSTYIGGSGNDTGKAIAVDAAPRVYVGGQTCAFNFPLTGNATQSGSGSCGTGVVAILDPNQSGQASLMYSTLLGGSGGESINGLVFDGKTNLYLAGNVNSTDFPLVNPLPGQNTGGGSSSSGFISIFSISDLFGGQ